MRHFVALHHNGMLKNERAQQTVIVVHLRQYFFPSLGLRVAFGVIARQTCG